MKIIIDIKDNIDQGEAINKVLLVVKGGRISQKRGIKHYCWVTTFKDGQTVYVRGKKTEKSADSFVVYKDSRP